MPILMESLPRSGPTLRSSITVKGAGKCAGTQQRRQHNRILDAETAADLPRTADDRLANDRRAENLAVEDDGERPADIGARDVGKRARPRAVEAEGNDRLAGLLVEAGAGVGQALAADGHAILDRITHTFGIGQDGHAGRRAAIERHGLVEHVEAHLRGGAEQFTQPGRVLQPGELDEETVGSDALDRGLGHADLVDALPDDLQALLDGGIDACVQSRLGEFHANEIALRGNFEVGRAIAEG
jgi:hypothetical protein